MQHKQFCDEKKCMTENGNDEP